MVGRTVQLISALQAAQLLILIYGQVVKQQKILHQNQQEFIQSLLQMLTVALLLLP